MQSPTASPALADLCSKVTVVGICVLMSPFSSGAVLVSLSPRWGTLFLSHPYKQDKMQKER